MIQIFRKRVYRFFWIFLRIQSNKQPKLLNHKDIFIYFLLL